MAKAATLRSAPAIEVAILRSGRVLQRSKNRFDSELAPIPWTRGLCCQRTIAQVSLDLVRGPVVVV